MLALKLGKSIVINFPYFFLFFFCQCENCYSQKLHSSLNSCSNFNFSLLPFKLQNLTSAFRKKNHFCSKINFCSMEWNRTGVFELKKFRAFLLFLAGFTSATKLGLTLKHNQWEQSTVETSSHLFEGDILTISFFWKFIFRKFWMRWTVCVDNLLPCPIF